MSVPLGEERRARLLEEFQSFFLKHFDEELSPFRGEQILDFFLGSLGPQVYNQGVQDARRFMADKLDDLDGEVYASDGG